MKSFTHFLLLVGIITLTQQAHAQKGKITATGGLGASKLHGELGQNGSFGLNYLLHGAYFLTDNVSVGLTYDASIIGYKNPNSRFSGISAYTPVLWQATGSYYFGAGKVKPYASLGLGAAKISTPELTVTDAQGNVLINLPAENRWNLAISPRLGIQFGKKFSLDYAFNYAGKTPLSTIQNITSGGKAFNFSTIALKYAYNFGGTTD